MLYGLIAIAPWSISMWALPFALLIETAATLPTINGRGLLEPFTIQIVCTVMIAIWAGIFFGAFVLLRRWTRPYLAEASMILFDPSVPPVLASCDFGLPKKSIGDTVAPPLA